jgi:hypothetical protein
MAPKIDPSSYIDVESTRNPMQTPIFSFHSVAVTNGKKEKADSKMVRMEKERDGERQEG